MGQDLLVLLPPNPHPRLHVSATLVLRRLEHHQELAPGCPQQISQGHQVWSQSPRFIDIPVKRRDIDLFTGRELQLQQRGRRFGHRIERRRRYCSRSYHPRDHHSQLQGGERHSEGNTRGSRFPPSGPQHLRCKSTIPCLGHPQHTPPDSGSNWIAMLI